MAASDGNRLVILLVAMALAAGRDDAGRQDNTYLPQARSTHRSSPRCATDTHMHSVSLSRSTNVVHASTHAARCIQHSSNVVRALKQIQLTSIVTSRSCRRRRRRRRRRRAGPWATPSTDRTP